MKEKESNYQLELEEFSKKEKEKLLLLENRITDKYELNLNRKIVLQVTIEL
jgi:hypothetical protein